MNKNTNRFSFIHPTKCGGTAVEIFLLKNYSKYFIMQTHHLLKCNNYNNPIIIIRDPIERFISLFKYWKYGSEIFIRDKIFLEKYKNISIKEFISLIKENKTNTLFYSFTWNKHFQKMTHWINNTDYKNIIILKYKNDMNDTIQKMLHLFKIPTIVDKKVEKCNISKNKEQIILDEEDIDFIKDFFKEDFELIHLINTQPKLFRAVL
jgi:hypothetical protein